jgi:hypothetical protein
MTFTVLGPGPVVRTCPRPVVRTKVGMCPGRTRADMVVGDPVHAFVDRVQRCVRRSWWLAQEEKVFDVRGFTEEVINVIMNFKRSPPAAIDASRFCRVGMDPLSAKVFDFMIDEVKEEAVPTTTTIDFGQIAMECDGEEFDHRLDPADLPGREVVFPPTQSSKVVYTVCGRPENMMFDEFNDGTPGGVCRLQSGRALVDTVIDTRYPLPRRVAMVATAKAAHQSGACCIIIVDTMAEMETVVAYMSACLTPYLIPVMEFYAGAVFSGNGWGDVQKTHTEDIRQCSVLLTTLAARGVVVSLRRSDVLRHLVGGVRAFAKTPQTCMGVVVALDDSDTDDPNTAWCIGCLGGVISPGDFFVVPCCTVLLSKPSPLMLATPPPVAA